MDNKRLGLSCKNNLLISLDIMKPLFLKKNIYEGQVNFVSGKKTFEVLGYPNL